MEEKHGVDRRLGESLKELAKKMPFEKITVRQIAEGAGVIRATFYNHFQDKYSLLEWILRTEILDPVALLLEHAMFREAIVLIFANMRKDREFYMRLTYMEGQNSFREVVGLGIRRLLLPVFDVRGKFLEHVWMRPEFLADYYARSMTFVIIEWIRTGMVVPPEEMAVAYEYMTTRSMADVVRELRGESPEEAAALSVADAVEELRNELGS